MTRYNIKGRLATLGKKNKDVIAEIKDRGISCSPSEFTTAIHGYSSPKSDRLCEIADDILKGWERSEENVQRET